MFRFSSEFISLDQPVDGDSSQERHLDEPSWFVGAFDSGGRIKTSSEPMI